MRRTAPALTVASIVCLGLAGPAAADPGGKAPSAPHRVAVVGGNSLLGINTGNDGFFNLGANPGTASAYTLSYAWPSAPWSSPTTVRIDGVNTRFQGASVTTSAAGGGSQSVATINGIQVTQRVTPLLSPTTGRANTALISYTMKNVSTVNKAVGVRSLMDTMIGDNDRAPFRVPGVGPVTNENTWSGAAVPSSFTVFRDLTSTAQVGEARFSGPQLTRPDVVKSASWSPAASSSWDYATNTARQMGDTSFLVYYNPTTLAPGASRTVAYSYGVGDATANTQGALNVGLTGPTALSLDGSNYAPNPFDVVGTIANSGSTNLTNVRVTLNLPSQLRSASPNPVTLGTLAPGGTDRQVTWNVTATPQATARTVSYSITVTADGVAAKTVTRTVLLPAVPGITQSPTTSPTSSPTTSPTTTSTTGTTTSTRTTTSTGDGTSTVTGPPVVTDGPAGENGSVLGLLGGGIAALSLGAAFVAGRLRRRD